MVGLRKAGDFRWRAGGWRVVGNSVFWWIEDEEGEGGRGSESMQDGKLTPATEKLLGFLSHSLSFSFLCLLRDYLPIQYLSSQEARGKINT